MQGSNLSSVGVTCTTDSFSIGGTVSGLAGRGLVLASATGETLAVSADGTFTFATPVASGAPFGVTVHTQPTSPWQVCSVAGGSGTVGNAQVASVAVTCATSSFTVGGSVAGLAGSGLSLSLNGGAGLAVSAGGSFVFPAPLLSGTPYTVTIAHQPASPSQTCTLAGATGTVAGANVTGVAARARRTPTPSVGPSSASSGAVSR